MGDFSKKVDMIGWLELPIDVTCDEREWGLKNWISLR